MVSPSSPGCRSPLCAGPPSVSCRSWCASSTHHRCPENICKIFLDPVGSLVSTLLVGCCWSLVGHTFSKLVNFECVGMLECVWVLVCCSVGMCWCAVVLKCFGVLVCWCFWCLGSLTDIRSLGSQGCQSWQSRNPKYSLMLWLAPTGREIMIFSKISSIQAGSSGFLGWELEVWMNINICERLYIQSKHF